MNGEISKMPKIRIKGVQINAGREFLINNELKKAAE